MNNEKAFKIKLIGKVQGVLLRQNLKEMADQLELSGSVENLSDSSVEIIIQGPELPLTNFINFCKQGNGMAKIDDVVIEKIDVSMERKTFTIK